MRHPFLPLCVLLLSACGGSTDARYAPPDPTRIARSHVERVLSVLASDSLRGRQAFTDDALRAADYLAGEFEAAGLQPMEGAGYLQRFPVRSRTARQIRVTLDGRARTEQEVVARAGASSVRWSTGDVPVLRIPARDDVQTALGRIRAVDGDALVLVPAANGELFSTLSGFYGRPVRTLEGTDGPTTVLALWEGEGEPTFEVAVDAEEAADTLVNVVGVVPGHRTNQYVLFSAHYDHIGIRPPVDGDSIANGANDDASGTTAVVELARYFASRGTPERSLLFAAFTAEEAGGYGSRHYSSQLDPDQIVAMFNIEMIGKPAVEGPNTAWITGFERSSFGPLLQEAVEGTPYSFYPDPYPDQNLFYRSDNATLARLGVPAHSISTTPIDVDPDYHQVSDEVGTLDLDHLTATIRAIAMGAERIIAGEATPTRVDPATVDPR